MASITVTEQSDKCIFTITMPSEVPVTAQIFDDNGVDISQDEAGNPGPVTMTDNGNGTYTGVVKICGVSSGKTIKIAVCTTSDPDNCEYHSITLNHDCPACEGAAMMEMAAAPQMAAPIMSKPVARKVISKAKAKPKSAPKSKPKVKSKAAKPAAKPKKAKAKAKAKAKPKSPAKAKKAKPAKKKVAAKKKRR